MSTRPDLIRIRQSVRKSRADISREYAGLVHELDFRRRFAESVRRHPLGWIGGAVSAGLLAALFGKGGRGKSPVRPPPQHRPPSGPAAGRAAWIVGALEIVKLLYPVLRPSIIELLGHAARSGLAKRSRLQ